MAGKVTVASLNEMKQAGDKIVGVVAWDTHIARIADRAGVEIISVGDSVGKNLWGHDNPLQVTMEQMMVVTQAVRRGVTRALVSVDYPYGPLQEGPSAALRAAITFVKEAGVDMVKLDDAALHPEGVEAVASSGIPVFAQMGMTPQTALRYGIEYEALSRPDAEVPDDLAGQLVGDAKRLEAAGASLLDFTNSGSTVGPQVVEAVSIPVIGGFGGGPWLDGRIRMALAAIGYQASAVDDPPDTYANVAQITLDALQTFSDDVRSGRQIRGGRPESVTQPRS